MLTEISISGDNSLLDVPREALLLFLSSVHASIILGTTKWLRQFFVGEERRLIDFVQRRAWTQDGVPHVNNYLKMYFCLIVPIFFAGPSGGQRKCVGSTWRYN